MQKYYRPLTYIQKRESSVTTTTILTEIPSYRGSNSALQLHTSSQKDQSVRERKLKFRVMIISILFTGKLCLNFLKYSLSRNL
jgi:hypothetical protein